MDYFHFLFSEITTFTCLTLCTEDKRSHKINWHLLTTNSPVKTQRGIYSPNVKRRSGVGSKCFNSSGDVEACGLIGV